MVSYPGLRSWAGSEQWRWWGRLVYRTIMIISQFYSILSRTEHTIKKAQTSHPNQQLHTGRFRSQTPKITYHRGPRTARFGESCAVISPHTEIDIDINIDYLLTDPIAFVGFSSFYRGRWPFVNYAFPNFPLLASMLSSLCVYVGFGPRGR